MDYEIVRDYDLKGLYAYRYSCRANGVEIGYLSGNEGIDDSGELYFKVELIEVNKAYFKLRIGSRLLETFENLARENGALSVVGSLGLSERYNTELDRLTTQIGFYEFNEYSVDIQSGQVEKWLS